MTQELRNKPTTHNRPADNDSQPARLAHREFAMAIGELTEDEWVAFLRSAMAPASHSWRRVTGERAIHAESGVDSIALELEETEARHDR